MGYFFKLEPPKWSGFMQKHVIGNHPGKSMFSFLPIINLSPSDESCIFSTLLFVQDQARQIDIPTPCITFDQPLYIKAFEIVEAKDMKIVLKLGGFHMLMSFLGGIEAVMDGSGLREVMETIYAKHTVNHMLDDKAYARAVRYHFLIDASLHHIMINKLVAEERQVDPNHLDSIKCLYKEMSEEGVGTIGTASVEGGCLWKIGLSLDEFKLLLSDSSRTSRLWIQYLHYIGIVKDFIYAERVGNWSLHLLPHCEKNAQSICSFRVYQLC